MFRTRGIVALFLYLAAVNAKQSDQIDYESLPRDTVFPGPWEEYIRAPANKSFITPVKIFDFEGGTSGAESVLKGSPASVDVNTGLKWVISPGGLITFEFGENIAGKYVTPF